MTIDDVSLCKFGVQKLRQIDVLVFWSVNVNVFFSDLPELCAGVSVAVVCKFGYQPDDMKIESVTFRF